MFLDSAFNVLEAKPTDNRETLEERYDETRLLSDDMSNLSDIEDAFNELMNPRKRIVHEITYFESYIFDDYFNLLSFFQDKCKLDNGQFAHIVVRIGKWFDEIIDDPFDLLDEINEARIGAGFSQIQDEDAILIEADNLKARCMEGITAYLDAIAKKSLVSVFNKIVKISDYDCFLVDDLMSYYELKIKETLRSKSDETLAVLKNLENACANTSTGYSVKLYSDELIQALKKFDYYAQPLQVNMQKHGGQHEISLDLVGAVRNRIIDIVNKAQGEIDQLISDCNKYSSSSSYTFFSSFLNSMRRLKTSIPKVLGVIDFADALFRDLIDIFIELELIAEMMRNDRRTLTSIRTNLKELQDNVNSQLDTVDKITNSTSTSNTSSSYSRPNSSYTGSNTSSTSSGHNYNYTPKKSGCYIATCVYDSYDCPEVWTLRRFRDYKLSKNIFGRALVSLYYKVSPHLVKRFGDKKWFKKLWGFLLDRLIIRLRKKGIEDTPYQDLK